MLPVNNHPAHYSRLDLDKVTEHYSLVKRFMAWAKQLDYLPMGFIPVIPPAKWRLLRAKLILEEALETINGLGVQVTVSSSICLVPPSLNQPETRRLAEFNFSDAGEQYVDLTEVVDGCCDTHVVVTGTLVACNVPNGVFQDEVDRSNLAKFSSGHYIREDGKLMKPPGWTPPAISAILDALRNRVPAKESQHEQQFPREQPATTDSEPGRGATDPGA